MNKGEFEMEHDRLRKPVTDGGRHPAIGVLKRHLQDLGYLDSSPVEDADRVDRLLLRACREMMMATTGKVAEIVEIDQALIRLAQQKRCGTCVGDRLRDSKRDSALIPNFRRELGWSTRRIGFAIGDFAPLESQDFQSKMAIQAIRNAASHWNQASAVEFYETDKNPKIVLECVRFEPHDIPRTIAHADYPPGNNLFGFPLQVHFNGSEPWTNGDDPARFNLERVAVHELGHCLGLFHYSNTIMSEILERGNTDVTIHPVLRARIQSLYRMPV